MPNDARQAFDEAVAEPVTDYQRRLYLARAAAAFGRSEVVAALEREHARFSLPNTLDRILPTEALMARYAELDAPAAVAWVAQTYPADLMEDDWLYAALDVWLSKDPAAALAWGHGLPAGTLRDTANSELLERFAAIDPAGAARQTNALGVREAWTFVTVFQQFARQDLSAACAEVAQLPAENQKNAVRGIIDTWARLQPADAYAWAARFPPGALRDAATNEFYTSRCEQDPAAAAAWLLAHGGSDVEKYSSDLASTWAKRDLASARAWCESLPPPLRQGPLASVVETWAETDPRGATEFVMTVPAGERGNQLDKTMTKWAALDLDAARAWVDQTPPGNTHDYAQSTLAYVWSEQDPRASALYLAGQANGASNPRALPQALRTWAESSADEVWAWSQTLPDPARRGQGAAAALRVLATDDPAGAGVRVGQLPAEAQPEAAGAVAQAWEQTDPVAAAHWVESLADPAARASATKAMVGPWAHGDAPAAIAWINGQPAGDARDAGINALILAVPDGLDPTATLRMAQSVQDPKLRDQSLSVALRLWSRQEPEAARAWIDQAPDLTPDERARFLSANPSATSP